MILQPLFDPRMKMNIMEMWDERYSVEQMLGFMNASGNKLGSVGIAA